MIFNVSSGGATKSNDNLIDNGWFNVNTRALKEYSDSGYTVDRWYKSNGSSGIVYVDDNGIRRADTTPYLRYFMSEKQRKSLNGKVLTFSTMTADGTIQSFTTEYDASHVFISNFDGNIIYGDVNTNYPNQVVGVHSNSDVDANKTLRAVKLEVGAVSTLKLDSMPKAYDEMLKCQMSGADESDAMSFITGGLAELKKSVSDGKREIATTITELGVATDNNASFSELSQNILQLGGKPELLWTNPKPTTPITSTKKIGINGISDYDYIIVTVRESTTNSKITGYGIGGYNKSNWVAMTNSDGYIRFFQMESNGIYLYGTILEGPIPSGANGTKTIPYQIYGVKNLTLE